MLEQARMGWTRSEKYWRAVLAIQFVAAGLGAWVAWARPEHGLVAVGLPVAGVVIPVLTLVLRSRADSAYTQAEAWRRVYFLNDSLGYEPSPGEYSALLLDADTTGPDRQRASAGPYYAAEGEKGPSRLLENLAESSFYTSELAKTMASECAIAALVGIALLVAVLVGVIASPSMTAESGHWLSDLGPRTAGLASALLAFFSAGQVIELAAAYHQLATASRRVHDQALAPRMGDASHGAVLSLLGSYDTALAAAARPIPNRLATRRGPELNKKWLVIKERLRKSSNRTGAE